MFDIEKFEINAAFYEIFENVFNEDFFSVLVSVRPSQRVASLMKKKAEELSEDESREVMDYKVKAGTKMSKYAPRVAYIGTKLYNKQYGGSYQDFLMFLATCETSDFRKPEVVSKIWAKVNDDQAVPNSVKNA